jgi:alanyl-tRNA synthetase
MEEQRTQARAHVKGDAWELAASALYEQILRDQGPSEFVGYSRTATTSQIIGLVVDGQAVSTISDGQAAELILDKTAFYAEKGGQVADIGTIILPDKSAGDAKGQDKLAQGVFTVTDTREYAGGIIAHHGYITGQLGVGAMAEASIDVLRREGIERNHTATHLLHSALKEILGDHVKQAGSLVSPDHLRFDFTHFEPLTPEELAAVEQLVNTLIREDSAVHAYVTTLDEARAAGVTALFGEKYGEQVRVLNAGPTSRELCGGTHVAHTAKIGLCKILSESSVGANLRRIEAQTSTDALERYKHAESELLKAAALLKTTPDEVVSRIQAQQAQLKKAAEELARLKSGAATGALSGHLAEALTIGGAQGYQLLVLRQDGLGAGQLRETADFLRQKLGESSAVVLGSLGEDNRPSLLAAATNQAVAAGFDAGALIRELAPLIEGKGGGKPSFAQAGGSNPSGLDAALAKAREIPER